VIAPEELILDFCDPALYDDPWATYRELRANDGLYRDEANDLWVVSRHADVAYVSRTTDIYCSSRGVRPKLQVPLSLISEDDPEHARQRRLIHRGFTPRRVRELIPHIRELSNRLIDDFADRGEIDFVEDMAIHVPLIIICEMLGLDPDTRMKMYRWSDAMMAGDGHTEADDPVLDAAAHAFGEYSTMCAELIAARRADPKDDLISVLTQRFDEGDLGREEFVDVRGALPGDPMSDDELNLFLTVLLIAGNETTRNAITGSLLALSRFPDEHRRLVEHLDDDEFMDLAVEELLRWVTPVISFTRTATRPDTLAGTELADGDRVLLLYQSANRDEAVFDRPDDLVLDRSPNPHLAFGIGPHFCLGANLARVEVKTVLQELFRRLPDIHVPETAHRTRGDSSLVIALQHLTATFTPA
jgi:cytochrome P450 family 142 subfamily A polypeptide 1